MNRVLQSERYYAGSQPFGLRSIRIGLRVVSLVPQSSCKQLLSLTKRYLGKKGVQLCVCNLCALFESCHSVLQEADLGRLRVRIKNHHMDPRSVEYETDEISPTLSRPKLR
jgi:hypothetical protein